MVISEITLFNTLREKLGEQTAQTVVEGIKTAVKEEFENKKDTLATKDELHVVKVDLIKWMVGLWITTILLIVGLYLKH